MMPTTAPSTSRTGTIAVVQWTHTMKMKPMLLVARHQIARDPGFEHHIVLSSCGDGAVGCPALLDASAPLVENVTCSNASEVAKAIPAFSSLKQVFHGKKATIPSVLGVGMPRWCWNSCDSPYLYWYLRTGSMLTRVRFFWFLEWDVVWTGAITTILSAWNSLNTSNPGLAGPEEDHDLVCPNPSWANSMWAHRGKRDEALVPNNVTYRCVTEVTRLSHRLLRSILAFSRSKRGAMFCEMRAASVCAMQPWCRMQGLFAPETVGMLYTARKVPGLLETLRNGSRATNKQLSLAIEKWVLSYVHNGGVTESMLMANLSEPMLYHAYKWVSVQRENSTRMQTGTLQNTYGQSLTARLRA